MKLASFQTSAGPSWGVIEGDVAVDVGAVLPGHGGLRGGLRGVLEGRALDAIKGAMGSAARHKLDGITWLPVIPDPGKIFCVGLNYENHRKETGRDVVGHPTIFARYANSQTGHLCPMVRPKGSTDFDYEGELAIVIGTGGRYIARGDAMAHIAGFACYNEGSVRDYQRHTSQFTPGKNFPDTGAFGPWMVTADEMGPIGPQRLQTRVNGTVLQDALLEQMIFDIPTQIEYCSSFTRLEPGDVIVTGTPGGVGSRREPPVWLKPGDMVEVEIDGVGVLRNPVTQEA